jgi:hypothetical protein
VEAQPAFLIVYDWACGQLVSADEYPSREDAELALLLAEPSLRDDPSIELRVVVPVSQTEG